MPRQKEGSKEGKQASTPSPRNLRKRNTKNADSSQDESLDESLSACSVSESESPRKKSPSKSSKTPEKTPPQVLKTQQKSSHSQTNKGQRKSVPGSQQNTNNSDQTSASSVPYLCVFVVVLLVLAIYSSNYSTIFFKGRPSDSENDDDKSTMKMFLNTFNSLKMNFSNQYPTFWKTIKHPVLRIISESNPEYPAVILFVVPKGHATSQTGTCLAKQYIRSLSSIQGESNSEYQYIDVQSLANSNSEDEVKLNLDKRIQRAFKSSNKPIQSVVIDHVEDLHPKAMLLFHGYCDGDHAPYKNAVILFVLHTDLERTALSPLDSSVDIHLKKLWENHLDEDKIHPLIARMANNKAIVKEEVPSNLDRC